MRATLLLLATAWLAASCTPEVTLDANLRHASGRVPYQTDPGSIAVHPGDVAAPYEVLADVEVILRQRGAFGELPTTEQGIAALREQAGRLGAHAIVMVAFGQPGLSFWSYNELRGHGRAIRFR